MKIRRTAPLSALLFTALGAAMLVGCSSDPNSLSAIQADPTPELMTLYERPVDVDNSLAIMSDENMRMFWQDLGRAFYTDRPSRLTRESIPH